MIRSILSLCVLGFTCGYIFAGLSTEFTDCSGGGTVINSLHMEPDPCVEKTEGECTIHLNTTYTGYVNFTSSKDHDEVFAHAFGVIGDIQEEFSIEHEACTSHVFCPIQQGLAQVYRAEVLVKEAALLRCAARFELRDENGDNVVCFMFGVVVLGH